MSIPPWVSTLADPVDPRLGVVIDDQHSANDGDVCLSIVTYKALKDISTPYCLDIGADGGWWTFFIKKHFPKSIIHGFEPNPYSYVGLAKRIEGKENVFMHHYAVSNKVDILKFHIGCGDTHSRNVKDGMPIPCRRIDQFLEGKEIDFVKIDTEGHEIYVLDGILPYSNKIKHMVFEFTIYWFGDTEEEQLERGKELLIRCFSHYKYMFSLSRRGIPQLQKIDKDEVEKYCAHWIKNHYSTDIYVTNINPFN